MGETIVVIILVIGVIFFLSRSVYRQATGKSDGCGGCGGCGAKSSCGKTPEDGSADKTSAPTASHGKPRA